VALVRLAVLLPASCSMAAPAVAVVVLSRALYSGLFVPRPARLLAALAPLAVLANWLKAMSLRVYVKPT